MTFRISVALSVALTLALPATVQASPQHYADRLATNARKATVIDNCLVLRSIDLCGYRVRLIKRATHLTADTGGCRDRGCWYELNGETKATKFFCRGYTVFYPRLGRWIADQSITCYADDDPTWTEDPDGVVIRTP